MSIIEFIHKVLDNDNLETPLYNVVLVLANEYLHRKMAYAFSNARLKKKDREVLSLSMEILTELRLFISRVSQSYRKETPESNESIAKNVMNDILARQEIMTFINSLDKKKIAFLLTPFSILDEDEIEYILTRIQQPLDTFFEVKNTRFR